MSLTDVSSHTVSGSISKAISNSPLCLRYCKELKRRTLNKASILLVCYSVPAFCCLFVIKTVAFGLIIPFQRPNCFEVIPDQDNDYSQYALRTLQTTTTYIVFPIMGWMAEVCVGRTKIMTFSMYSMWLGMVILTLTYVISLSMCGIPFDVIKYSGTFLGLICLILGTAGFFANLPAYILEQMMSEPSDKLRASVNWLTWALFVGVTIHYFLPQDIKYGNRRSVLVASVLITVLCTIVLVIHQFCSKYFVKVGTMNKNPSKLIWNVVLYAFKNQPYSKRRSALSYWDKVIPSKFDLGKEKYGGPFSDEDVEDVKSFWRVFFVLCSLIGFYITFSAISDDGLSYITMFKDSTKFLNSHILFAFISGFFLIFIPLLELILIPCYPKIDYWMQSSLRGMGVSYVLFCVSVLLMFILDIIGQYKAGFKSGCYIDHKLEYDVSFLWYIGPFLLFSFGDMLNFIFTILFIMSQAPLRMCGVLTGLFWLLRAIGSNLAVLIKIPFDIENYSKQFPLACSFWILLIHCLICFICILCYVKLARTYQKRKKNVAFLGKEVVEEYYERLMNETDDGLSYPPLLTRSSDYFTYEAAIQNMSSPIN